MGIIAPQARRAIELHLRAEDRRTSKSFFFRMSCNAEGPGPVKKVQGGDSLMDFPYSVVDPVRFRLDFLGTGKMAESLRDLVPLTRQETLTSNLV